MFHPRHTYIRKQQTAEGNNDFKLQFPTQVPWLVPIINNYESRHLPRANTTKIFPQSKTLLKHRKKRRKKNNPERRPKYKLSHQSAIFWSRDYSSEQGENGLISFGNLCGRLGIFTKRKTRSRKCLRKRTKPRLNPTSFVAINYFVRPWFAIRFDICILGLFSYKTLITTKLS